MRALVISGGGSKGAFAGGVAEFLLQDQKRQYDLFIGTSTGSLMITHLALGKVQELKEIYSNVSQSTIFNNCPFRIKEYKGHKVVSINHLNTFKSFVKGLKTFGESRNLRQLIDREITDAYLQRVKNQGKELVATVSNLTLNKVEFKTLSAHGFDDFRDYIWASSNFVPFMSLMVKDSYEYADGGFGNLVPISQAIQMGATEIDAIILDTEVTQLNRLPSKNPFGLINNLFGFMQLNIEKFNVSLAKLEAETKGVKLNLYFTPTVLTTNTLIFDKERMQKWWEEGYRFCKSKTNEEFLEMGS